MMGARFNPAASIASGFMDVAKSDGDDNGSGNWNGKRRAGVVRRWDGSGDAGEGAEEWDALQKDPELWLLKGNCLIHLHAKGHSTKGPSFKLPFATLLKASCYPLIQRFLVLDGPAPRSPSDILRWYYRGPKKTIELYIPPPPKANKSQTLQYHLCTRNLIAWVLKKPLVGEHLGCAMVGLLNSMHEFRDGPDDNLGDMMTYLEGQGYLDLVERPENVLGAMHLAETFQLRELYVRAFCHCVGMSEQLHMSTEYENLNFPSRKLIRQARQDMDFRITHASSLLQTFLDDELSESRLGIPSGARAHLERFRSFLLSFYSTKLGYYPPRDFSPQICQDMGEDFAALYELLVDDEHACSETSMPTVAVGGICTLQLVQAFDQRKEFEPLDYPLPLLPQVEDMGPSAKKMGWLMRRDKGKANERLVAHMALINASNWRETTSRNDLVRAYRNFEEECVVAPNKVDKHEKVSLADARKIRWIMVYAVHQVLRSVNQRPEEVSVEDAEEASYHLAVSAESIPVWDDTTHNIGRLVRSQTDMVGIASEPHVSWGNMGLQLPVGTIEIKPDIDYFALTHQERPSRARRASASLVSDSPKPILSRSGSVTRALTRSSTLRRSMRIFRPATASSVQSVPMSPSRSPSRQAYQEIVVHGYGNGMNDGKLDAEAALGLSLASRSDSTASHTNSSVGSARESTNSSADTIDSSVKTPSPISLYPDVDFEMEMKARRWSRPEMFPTGLPLTLLPASNATSTQHRRLMSTVIESGPHSRASSYMGEPETYHDFDHAQHISPPGPPRSASFISRHSLILPDLKRKNTVSGNKHAPVVRIRDSDADEMDPHQLRKDSLDWTAMQTFIDGTDGRVDGNGDVLPAWEQYADLGGLTEMT